MAVYANSAVRIAAQAMLMREQNAEIMLTAYDQLTPTQRIFVDAYVATDSPIRAIKAAQPGLTGSLPNVRAMEMLRNTLVQAAIADRIKKATEKYRITLERTLEEIAKIGYANIDDFIEVDDQTGAPRLNLHKATRDQMGAISGFDVKETKSGEKIVTLKLHDKNSALDKAMKYLGAYQNADTNVNINMQNNVDNRSVTVNMTDAEAADLYARSLEED